MLRNGPIVVKRSEIQHLKNAMARCVSRNQCDAKAVDREFSALDAVASRSRTTRQQLVNSDEYARATEPTPMPEKGVRVGFFFGNLI
jgi:hypothetical protein